MDPPFSLELCPRCDKAIHVEKLQCNIIYGTFHYRFVSSFQKTCDIMCREAAFRTTPVTNFTERYELILCCNIGRNETKKCYNNHLAINYYCNSPVTVMPITSLLCPRHFQCGWGGVGVWGGGHIVSPLSVRKSVRPASNEYPQHYVFFEIRKIFI